MKIMFVKRVYGISIPFAELNNVKMCVKHYISKVMNTFVNLLLY